MSSNWGIFWILLKFVECWIPSRAFWTHVLLFWFVWSYPYLLGRRCVPDILTWWSLSFRCAHFQVLFHFSLLSGVWLLLSSHDLRDRFPSWYAKFLTQNVVCYFCNIPKWLIMSRFWLWKTCYNRLSNQYNEASLFAFLVLVWLWGSLCLLLGFVQRWCLGLL